MAKQQAERPDPKQNDSDNHARPSSVYGGDGRVGDRSIIPGEGVLLSRSAVRDYDENADKWLDKNSIKRHDAILIDEDDVLRWAKIIAKERSMRTDQKPDVCYEGTDTIDPTKHTGSIHRKRNYFKVDSSQSTICLMLSNTTPARYLNGSHIEHSKYISLHITTPDGRRYADVALSFDQFAHMLVSNSPTPCTLDDYWSTDDSVLLREVVKEPDTIEDRLKGRIDEILKDTTKLLDDISVELTQNINDNKPVRKNQLIEVINTLNRVKSQLPGNITFMLEQAHEEVDAMMNDAVSTISLGSDIQDTIVKLLPGIQKQPNE